MPPRKKTSLNFSNNTCITLAGYLLYDVILFDELTTENNEIKKSFENIPNLIAEIESMKDKECSQYIHLYIADLDTIRSVWIDVNEIVSLEEIV
jgi:hypothetical protein